MNKLPRLPVQLLQLCDILLSWHEDMGSVTTKDRLSQRSVEPWGHPYFVPCSQVTSLSYPSQCLLIKMFPEKS